MALRALLFVITPAVLSAAMIFAVAGCASAEPTPDIPATVRSIITASAADTPTPVDAAATAIAVVMAIPPAPTATPAPTVTPPPPETPVPTSTPQATPAPVDVAATFASVLRAVPTETAVPIPTPASTATPQAVPTAVDVLATVASVVDDFTPVPTDTPAPEPTPDSTSTPQPTVTPQPTATPMSMPDVASTAEAVVLAQPTITPIPLPGDREGFAVLIEKVKKSVVLIRGDDGDGSGFVIHEDGYILTNQHVIEKSRRINVLIDGRSHRANVIAEDEVLDIALLKIEPSGKLEPLRFADDAYVGEEVIMIGYPLSLKSQVTATKGIVSGFPVIQNSVVLQVDASTNSGNSGSPVLNLRGEVVGMVKSKAIRMFQDREVLAEGINYAVSLADVRDFWERRGAPAPPPTPITSGDERLVLGPESGSVAHTPDADAIDEHSGLVWVANGKIEVTLHNPFPRRDGDWSTGLKFRSNSDSVYAAIVSSSGYASFHFWDGDEWESLRSKRSSRIDLTGRGSNKLRVVMNGAKGEFWINGARSFQLDLSANLAAGDVKVIGNFFTGHGKNGASTEFEEFRIWRSE